MNDETKDDRKPGRVPFLLLLALAAATLAAGLHIKGAGAPSVAGGPVSMTARVNRGAVLSGRDGRVELELVLGAVDRGDAAATVPTDVLVVLDRSGSMEGEKIAQGLAAVKELIDRLGPRDRFALVAYSDEAQLELPLETASREAKSRWWRRVGAIAAGGSTNMSSGLDLAYDSLGASADESRAVRVLLISDGLANRGDATPEGLFARAARFTSREQVVSTIGVGLDFNEFLMSSIADAGTGNYYYLENVAELSDVFAREFSATRSTVASGVAVTLTPGEGVEVVDAAGYPLTRNGRSVTFRPGTLFSGQERTIWISYRVPSDALGDYELGKIALDYKADGEARSLEIPGVATVACVQDKAAFFASVDKDAWEDSVVNESYGRLKERVARAVREGDLETAKQEIGAYRAEHEWMNGSLRLEGVERNLAELKELEARVEDAFTGRDQALKQNVLSKATQSEASDARRAGSKK